jgi:hypothetical protein
VIVEVEAARKGDPWPGGEQHLGLGPALRCEKLAAVDHRRGQGAMIDHRSIARMPMRPGVMGEVLGRLVAEEFHGVAPFDQGHALSREAFEFDGADLGAILFALATPLRLLIVVEFALDPCVGAVEEIDGRPQQVFEVALEAGVAQGRDEGVEDVSDGAGNDTGFGHRSRVVFVLEGTIAVKLEFGEDVIGRGCGVRRLVVCLVVLDRHGGFPSLDWSRSSRPSWRRKAAGGPDLHRGAQRSGRSKAEDGGSRLF